MKSLASRIGRSHFLKGFASVASFVPRSSRYVLDLPVDLRSTTETLADDWRSVFGDLQTAASRIDQELIVKRPETKAANASL